ncbi:MAG: tyrosine-type recombinase/integrase [Microcoleaceae cyanobacterium]
MARSKKGSVSIGADKGFLRLYWRYKTERYFMTVGLPDTPLNRSLAQQKATQIELDILADNFDPTLRRYKTGESSSSITVGVLFEKFTEYKAERVDSRTLEKYRACLGYISDFLGERKANEVDEKLAIAFSHWLKEKMAARTAKEHLALIRAAFDYGIKEGLAKINPWTDVVKRFKVPPKQKAKPFTLQEIRKIIETFRQNAYYGYYTDYVEFLFGTGCRTSEAVGLCWRHLNDDCSTVWVGESLSRNRRKPTKTNRARTITLSPYLQKLLLARRPEKFSSDDLVFKSRTGRAIDDHNFRNRAWTTILEEAAIEYRKPYTTRHTFISHALERGMNPVLVAELTGHDVRTLYEEYAGCIESRPRLPDLLSPEDEYSTQIIMILTFEDS